LAILPRLAGFLLASPAAVICRHRFCVNEDGSSLIKMMIMILPLLETIKGGLDKITIF
jgi:hypothetical protein